MTIVPVVTLAVVWHDWRECHEPNLSRKLLCLGERPGGVSAAVRLGILSAQLTIRCHLGEQGMSLLRRIHNSGAVNLPRRDALHGMIRQQRQDFVTLAAAGRIPAAS